MLPDKIIKWLQKEVFPQRVLISGSGDLLPSAVKIAAQLQNSPESKMLHGGHEDTLLLRDHGKSLKIDFSEAAKKDEQNEYENIRGMIRWVSQKPLKTHYRIIILENFERATREAPHSILKILEEPPPRAIFLFTTQNHYRIMETILSRMTVVRIPQETVVPDFSETIAPFLESDRLIEKFQIIDEIDKTFKKEKNRKIFYDFLLQLIHYARLKNIKLECLETMLDTQNAIARNQNPKFSLERLALKLQR